MSDAVTETLSGAGEEKAESTAPVRIRGSLHLRLKNLAKARGGKIGVMTEKAIEAMYFPEPAVVPFQQ